MTVTKNTIIAEILNNDPTQGCVPIFLRPLRRPAPSTVLTPTLWSPS